MTPGLREWLDARLAAAFEAGRAAERARAATFSAAPREPALGPARWLAASRLAADPARFQFRHDHDADDGTARPLPEAKFDVAKCPPLVAWRDPADGTEYVVDGHHRLAWAERDGVARLPVRLLDCATAEEARAWGERANARPATFAAPGPPPRPGLTWKDETHRWVNPHTGEEHEHAPGGAAASAVHYHGPVAPAEGWTHVAAGPDGTHVWRAPPQKPGVVGRLLGRPRPAAALDPLQAGHTAAHTLRARMDASPEYRAARDRVEARNAGPYQQLAAAAGTSPEAVGAQIAAKAQALVDPLDLYVRVRPETLAAVLDAGRFKTVHETGTSEALADPKLRREVEAKGMGVGSDEPPQTRPVSAYLGGKDFATVGRETGVAAYGAVVVKLKPRVRDRATVTFGDSLEQIQNGYAVASPLARIEPATVNPRELLHDPAVLDSHAAYHARKGFIEAQVHGGLSTADVEEVAFPADPGPAVRAALEGRGIRWRLYGAAATHAAAFAARAERLVAAFAAHLGEDDGREWFSDDAYALMSAGSRAGLKLAEVTDKNGRRVKRWVREETEAGSHTPAARGHAEEHVERALRDPAALAHHEVQALAGHLAGIPRERLRQLALAAKHRIGPTRAAVVARLLDHVRAARTAAAPAPPPAGDSSAPAAAPTPSRTLDQILRDLRSRPAPAPAPAPTPAAGSGSAPPTDPPRVPRNVTIDLGRDPPAKLAARRAVAALFGSDLLSGVEVYPPEVLAAAAMAPDGARVRVASVDPDRPSITFETRGDGYHALRTFHRDRAGNLVCHNDYFRITKKLNPAHDPADPRSRKWINANPAINGAEMLANQVRALRALGVKRIDTHAARSDSRDGNPNNAMNGYATWPRLGYDDSIGAEAYRQLPPGLKAQVDANPTGSTEPRSVLNLMTTPEGRKWWDKNGTSLYTMEFDLAAGSLSMRTLAAYLAKRNGNGD